MTVPCQDHSPLAHTMPPWCLKNSSFIVGSYMESKIQVHTTVSVCCRDIVKLAINKSFVYDMHWQTYRRTKTNYSHTRSKRANYKKHIPYIYKVLECDRTNQRQCSLYISLWYAYETTMEYPDQIKLRQTAIRRFQYDDDVGEEWIEDIRSSIRLRSFNFSNLDVTIASQITTE